MSSNPFTLLFIALKENNESLSFEELSAKLDGILLTYAKKGLTSANSEIETPEESNPVSKVDLPFNETSKKKSRYGSLFSKSN